MPRFEMGSFRLHVTRFTTWTNLILHMLYSIWNIRMSVIIVWRFLMTLYLLINFRTFVGARCDWYVSLDGFEGKMFGRWCRNVRGSIRLSNLGPPKIKLFLLIFQLDIPLHIRVCVSVLRMYVFIYVYVGMCAYLYVFACFVCVCVYTYIYIHTHILSVCARVVYCSYSEKRIPVDWLKCTYIVHHCGIISSSYDHGILYFLAVSNLEQHTNWQEFNM
jgi:hypothetical protein